MKNKKENRIIILLSIVCILLLGAVGFTVYRSLDKRDNAKESGGHSGELQSDVIEVDGVSYKLNRNLKTVLFLGIDKRSFADMGDRPGENGQSDSLNLLVADKETRKAQILQISRDCMVDIDIYAANGEKLMLEQGQIALQYAYGDGKQHSCNLTTKKVSELLYGVDIPYYFSLTLEGMVHASDILGGVTLTVPEDYTSIDSSFVKGQTITLRGEKVEKYVRTRDTDILESNVDRMQRQSQFMSALIEQMQSHGAQVSGYYTLYQEMEEYMVTNMTADEIMDLSEYEISDEILNVPGEVILKDGHAQYIVDNKKLRDIVLKMFYKRK